MPVKCLGRSYCGRLRARFGPKAGFPPRKGITSVPFCTSCGNEARDADQFCGHCGYRQPVSGPNRGPARSGLALSPRTASILCYVPWFGWIGCLYVLASDKFRQEQDSRFHAYQGLYLFVAWLLADWTLGLWVQMMPGPQHPAR